MVEGGSCHETRVSSANPEPFGMLPRSACYIIRRHILSRIFWAWWDEDALTWHNRLPQTYLSVLPTH